jgi:hypothetical protein
MCITSKNLYSYIHNTYDGYIARETIYKVPKGKEGITNETKLFNIFY